MLDQPRLGPAQLGTRPTARLGRVLTTREGKKISSRKFHQRQGHRASGIRYQVSGRISEAPIETHISLSLPVSSLFSASLSCPSRLASERVRRVALSLSLSLSLSLTLSFSVSMRVCVCVRVCAGDDSDGSDSESRICVCVCVCVCITLCVTLCVTLSLTHVLCRIRRKSVAEPLRVYKLGTVTTR